MEIVITAWDFLVLVSSFFIIGAEWGVSVVGLVKAIKQHQQMQMKSEIASDKKFLISADHKATEVDGPYPAYAVLQEFGWTHLPEGNPYFRPAINKVVNQSSRVINAIFQNESLIDGNPHDALLQALAKGIQEQAKKNAPEDTGTLKETIFVEEIDDKEEIF